MKPHWHMGLCGLILLALSLDLAQAQNPIPNPTSNLGAAPSPATSGAMAACLARYQGVGLPRYLGAAVDQDRGPNPQTVLICRRPYAVSFNRATGSPDFAIEHLVSSDVTGPAKRKDNFMPDPLVGNVPTLEDYKGTGFDRGHQAPAGDAKFSQAAMDDTFYLTNMSPQVGQGFNRDTWAKLEGRIRAWLVCGVKTELYVITGPVFSGARRYAKPDSQALRVPDAYFKIVYDPVGKRAVGFVLPNTKIGGDNFTPYVKSIKEIEGVTGLSFFPALSVRDQNLVKSSPGLIWGIPGQCSGKAIGD